MFASLLLQGSALLFGFISSWYIARHLGAAQYGAYAYVFQWAVVLGGLVAASYDKLLVRYIALYSEQPKGGAYQKGLLYGVVAMGTVGSSMAILFCLFLAQHEAWLPTLRSCAMAAIGLTALTAACQAYLSGRGYTVAARVPELLLRPGLLCAGLGLSLLLRANTDLTASKLAWLNIAAMTLACLAALGYAAYHARGQWHGQVAFAWDDWLPDMRWFAWSGAAALLQARSDVLLLGWILPGTSIDLGIYLVALRLSDLAKTPLIALNMTIAPQIAILHAQGNTTALQQLVSRQGRKAWLLSTCIIVGLLGFGKIMLPYWGNDFEAAYLPLCWLCAGQWINVACGPAGNLLNMTGHAAVAFRSLLMTMVVGIVAQIVGICWWGATGAAAATALSMLVWNSLMTWQCRQKTGIRAAVWQSGIR